MPSRFGKYKKQLGFANAMKLYLFTKAKKQAAVRFSFLQHPVYFRNIYSDIAIFEQIFIEKQYQLSIDKPVKTIIDLGANVGYASLYFNKQYANANIIAVEPETNNYLQAKMNLQSYKNIQLLNGAVWYKNEDIFLMDKGLGEAGFMVNTEPQGNVIKAYTIPTLMKMLQTDIIDILKMDIEGAEKEIFENGTEKWLPKTQVLIVETHDRYRRGTSKAVMAAICKYDFSLELSGENLIFTNNNLINNS